jgi:hypothetical protein
MEAEGRRSRSRLKRQAGLFVVLAAIVVLGIRLTFGPAKRPPRAGSLALLWVRLRFPICMPSILTPLSKPG